MRMRLPRWMAEDARVTEERVDETTPKAFVLPVLSKPTLVSLLR